MYSSQVQGRKVADSSKQATLGDSGLTIQNTVEDIEEHQNKENNRNWLFWLNHLCNFEF